MAQLKDSYSCCKLHLEPKTRKKWERVKKSGTAAKCGPKLGTVPLEEGSYRECEILCGTFVIKAILHALVIYRLEPVQYYYHITSNLTDTRKIIILANVRYN